MLSVLALVLGVPVAWLRADRDHPFITLDYTFPGVPGTIKLQTTTAGLMAEGYSWRDEPDPETGIPTGPEGLASLWTDLGYWRLLLLEGVKADHFDDDEWPDGDEMPPGEATAPVEFLEAMAKALRIALAPLADPKAVANGARFREGAVQALIDMAWYGPGGASR